MSSIDSRDALARSPHAAAVEQVVAALVANVPAGLTSQEAQRRLREHGANALAEAPRTPTWRRFARQFRELVVLILIVAAVIAGLLGELLDMIAILTVVVLNATLGFAQEARAARAIDALRKLTQPRAHVLRDGVVRELPARELVPGDVLRLEAGDGVPADARLLESVALHAQEAPLTGESEPVVKRASDVLAAATPLADRTNMLHLGTVVAAGRGTALVTATGMATELGRIAGLIESSEPEPTPLQLRLAGLGRLLVGVCIVLVIAIAVVHLARGEPLGEVLVLAVGLAVASVPEGLPAVVTIALALGLRRLVERNALVRKLPSVETLGSVTVICSDKTGTLTRNEMTVRELRTASAHWHLGGSGYVPRGSFRRGEATGAEIAARSDAELARALLIGVRCNNARLTPGRDSDGPWQVIGDPTEGALLVAAMKAGFELELAAGEHVLFEIPFDSDRKAMSVAVANARGGASLYVKGALEVLLPRCTSQLRDGMVEPLTDADRQRILDWSGAMARRALRVLALAYRETSALSPEHAEEQLVFVGLAGMQDPPRDEAPSAVRTCLDAGIRPVMITGDHAETALAIAREVGIAGAGDRAVSGVELDRWTQDQLEAEVEHIAVYARTTAEHKLRVVRAWKTRGHVVAMTGDGVNDAPALQEADIGIAMGRSGTDVTREAADMVLVDDNFASIAAAVREGRGIFDNIRKFVHYLLATNAAEVLLMLFAALVGWPIPLAAIQLLWINLVTDGLPALALGVEPAERDVMRRRPLHRRAPVVSRADGFTLLCRGALMAAAAAAAFGLALRSSNGDVAVARSTAFAVIVFGQLSYVLAFRSERYTLPQLGPFSNPTLLVAIAVAAALQLCVQALPLLRETFQTAALGAEQWKWVAVLSLAPVSATELSKIVRERTRRIRIRGRPA